MPLPRESRSATVESGGRGPGDPTGLHLSLFGDLQRVVDLDSEVSDGALEFGVTEQELNRPEIPGPPVDQRRLGASHRMSAVGRLIKPNRARPGMNDPGILPSRKVRRRRHAARKEKLLRLQVGGRDPGSDRVPRLFGDLELHRPLGLLLHDNRAWGDMTALDHIANAKPDQIAPAQFAVDSEVEQREFTGSMIQLQSNPDGPDLLQLQRGLLADQLPFVPRYCRPSALETVLVSAYMNGSFVVERSGGSGALVDPERTSGQGVPRLDAAALQ